MSYLEKVKEIIIEVIRNETGKYKRACEEIKTVPTSDKAEKILKILDKADFGCQQKHVDELVKALYDGDLTRPVAKRAIPSVMTLLKDVNHNYRRICIEVNEEKKEITFDALHTDYKLTMSYYDFENADHLILATDEEIRDFVEKTSIPLPDLVKLMESIDE
jgi:hypothetical protein